MTRNALAAVCTLSLVATAVLAAPAEAKLLAINPQAGATWTNFSFDDDAALNEESGKVGYTLGGNVRLGGPFHLNPGLYYQKTSFEATAVDDVTLESVTDVVGISAVQIPVYLGFHLGAVGTGVRVYAGPSVTFVTGVDDNDFGADKDDFESSIFGGVLGAGADLSRFTFDLNYEIGISEATTGDAGAKQNVLRALLGIKLR